MITEGARPVDIFATHLGTISEYDMNRLRSLVKNAEWRYLIDRLYDTADVDFWEPCRRAFLIRIPAGGSINRHHDDFIKEETDHLVIETNPGCENWWIDRAGRERMIHMAEGQRYRVERSPIHWAFNRGTTPRIHLLVEKNVGGKIDAQEHAWGHGRVQAG